MSDHAASEHHDHDDHLEVFEDSGITETSKPVFRWLWVVYAVFILYFHWFVGAVFWSQAPEHPKWGAGWQGVAGAENWPWNGTPHGSASTGITGEDPADREVKNREATAYHNPYGARR